MECHNDMTFVKLMYEFINEHKTLFGFFVLILLAQPIRDILMPHLIGKIYTAIKDKKDFRMLIAAIIGVTIVIQCVHIADDNLAVILHPELYKFVRERMMGHMFRSKETNYSDVDIGEVIAKIIKLPSVMHNQVDLIRWEIIPAVCTLAAVMCYLLYTDWKLGVPFLGVIAVLVGTLLYTMQVCTADSFLRDEKFSLIMSNISDVMRNMITVMSFDKVDAEFSRMDDIQKEYAAHTYDTLQCSLRSKYVIIPTVMAFILYACYYCYSRVKKGSMESGTFVTIAILLFLVMKVIFDILGSWKDVLLKSGIIENSLRNFEECSVPSRPYNNPAEDSTGIRFQNVDFAYVSKDMQRPVFKDFRLNIRMKETTLIVGEIGSGKSTIISLLLKYQRPQAGEIFLMGAPYSSIDAKELRRRISYIPQTPILLNRSVYENIVYGIPVEPSKEEVIALIEQMQLKDFLNHLPKGLDTSVGVHGAKLSGGQRQIVWILKAILMKPEIIIMDEPTAAVDDSTKEIVQHLLRKVMIGKTVLMVTHDPYLLRFANRMITLKEGVVVKDERK